jgi:hypothetical protein
MKAGQQICLIVIRAGGFFMVADFGIHRAECSAFLPVLASGHRTTLGHRAREMEPANASYQG